ncbi:phage tail tape measure protein [Lysobacter sp. Root96]|uniref:phage tail tape measure protein n=1 Tax=Lysobacter sp. Root96 TaxID=1736612 RepID=UPI0006F5094D|nr:phage tail tape measure protein [Lysobacter sp. Root96]KRD71452.1 hypothetical protein ASE45_06485 [Lysobacter sp. Root96]
MATAGSIVVDLLLRTGSFETDSKRAEKRVKELEKAIDGFAKKLGTAVGVGAAAAVTALVSVTTQAINYADQLDEMSARLGISTEKLSGLGYAAKLSGLDLDSLGSAFPKLSKNLAAALDPTSKQAELFKALGVAVTDGVGKLREVEDVLPDLADRFKTLDDDTMEAALAMELFGKSGAEMLEFLNRGSDGLAELEARAAQLGIVVGQDTAEAAGQFKDELDDLAAIATGLGLQLAQQLLPQMIELVDKFQQLVQDGSAVEKIVSAVDFVIDDLGTSFDQLNHLIETTTNFFGGLRDNAQGTLEVLAGVATLDWSSFSKGLDTMDAARSRVWSAGERFEDFQARQNRKPTGQIPSYLNLPGYLSGQKPGFSAVGFPLITQPGDPIDTKKLDRFFTGGSKPKKGSSGKSDAEREAEKLQASYEQIETRLKEQVALFGKTGEAAQLRYDLEQGALDKLTPTQKAYLIDLAEQVDLQEQTKELEEAAAKAGEQYSERFKEHLSDLEFELKLLGLSNVERQKAVELRYAGIDAMSEEAVAIGNVIDQLHNQEKAISMMDEFRSSAADALTSIVTDFDNALDHAKDFFDGIAEMITRAIAERWMEQLFGSQGQAGGGQFGDALGGFLGFLGFGGARAGGGDVWPNSAFLVGEEGPELFVPRTAGAILPAELTAERRNGTARMVQQTFNQVINGPMTRRTAEMAARENGRNARRGLARTGG